MASRRLLGAALLLSAVAAGCGKDGGDTPVGPATGQGAADGAKYLLAQEPSGGRGVRDVRKDSKDGDEVVLVGRILGSAKSLAGGRCAFTVVDPAMEICPDGCCVGEEQDLATGRANVKFVGADGKPLAGPPEKMLGVTPRAIVVVQGKASRDAEGNLTVVASGLHVRK